MAYTYKSDVLPNFQKYHKQLSRSVKDVLGKMAVGYASKAMQYTPPGMRSKAKGIKGTKIDKDLYQRQFVYLPKAVKDPKNKVQKKDAEMLRQGFLFRLISLKKLKETAGTSYRSGSTTIYGYYFKKLSTLKRYQKIRFRGLYKISFGSNLESIMQKIPSAIKGLMNRAKDLWNMKFLNIFDYVDADQTLKIKNAVKDNIQKQGFWSIANGQGEKEAEKILKKQMKKIAEKQVKV